MNAFSAVTIIYNPVSTGEAHANARALQKELKRRLPALPVSLLATRAPGDATTLAYQAARATPKPLLIAASGDGGYSELINGALRAQSEGAVPVCAVLASGNANDHARTIQYQPLPDAIQAAHIKRLDVLQVRLRKPGGPPTSRYVHAYVGLGVTPAVATQLNRTALTSWRETLIMLRALWQLRPVKVESQGTIALLDSLICSTIPEMAKYFTLDKSARPDDSMFELTLLPHHQKVNLLWQVLRGMYDQVGAERQLERYGCRLLCDAPIQLDGEVMKVSKGTELTVTVCPGLLRTIY